MNIIKPGKTPEEREQEAIRKSIKTFECSTCECVFTADKTEYQSSTDYIYEIYYCECPNCGNRAYQKTGRSKFND